MRGRQKDPGRSQIAARESARRKGTGPVTTSYGPFPFVRIGTIKVERNSSILDLEGLRQSKRKYLGDRSKDLQD